MWEGCIKEVIPEENEYLVSFNRGHEDIKLPANAIRGITSIFVEQRSGSEWSIEQKKLKKLERNRYLAMLLPQANTKLL